MMSSELVSIVVPIYNVGDYVECCIKSLMNQTYGNIEIILVNDGSKDDSLSICRKYESIDPRITVIDQENQGVSVARNAGIDICKGEWICFVDGDDWLDIDAIEKMLDSVLDDTDVLITDYYVNSVSKEWSESFFILDNYDFNKNEHIELIKNCFLKTSFSNYHAITMVGVPWAKLFRTDVIKKNNIIYDKSLRKMQDALFCSEVFENCSKVIYRKISTYHYRQNNNSVTHRGNKNYLNVAESILKALDDFIIKYNYEEELRSIYYARKFIFACDTVKFVYILDDSGLSFFDKSEGVKNLFNGLNLKIYEKDMISYLSKAYKIVLVFHKLHLYGVMYLSMELYYNYKINKVS